MRKGIELKAKLLKTAVKLFEVHGYTNTTTRMIADEAGVGRGHLSYYFPKKEDISRELMRMFFMKVETFTYEEVHVDCEDPYVYFAFLFKCFEYFIDTSDYFKMMIIEGEKINSVYSFSCQTYMNLIEKKMKLMNLEYDKDELFRSIEFAVLIFNHMTTNKVRNDINISKEVYPYAIRHFLLELHKSEEFIVNVINRANESFNKLDLEQFYKYIHLYNYKEILENDK